MCVSAAEQSARSVPALVLHQLCFSNLCQFDCRKMVSCLIIFICLIKTIGFVIFVLLIAIYVLSFPNFHSSCSFFQLDYSFENLFVRTFFNLIQFFSPSLLFPFCLLKYNFEWGQRCAPAGRLFWLRSLRPAYVDTLSKKKKIDIDGQI